MAKRAKTPTTEHTLDVFVGPLRGKGDQSVAILVRDHVGPENPSTKQVQAAIDFFKEDSRFILTDKGLESTVRLVEQPDGFGPEEISEDEARQAAKAFVSSGQSDTAASPPATGEAAPVPTIGEQLAKQDAEQHQVEAVETIDLEPTAEEAQRRDDRVRAFEEKEAELKRLAAGIDALDNKIEHLKKDLKNTKDEKKVLEGQRDELIKGDLQPSIPTDAKKDTDPADTPVGKAISGQAPMLSEAPVEGMIRKMGAESARQGKTELDCPISREKDAKGRAQWLDGFRETKRVDHSEREAIVQALTREQLVEASADLGSDGILPPGEECPKVRTVKWDHQPHLVVGMLAADESMAGVERWHLLPTYDADEWANLYQETFGPPIKGVDKGDEEKAKRISGGIDAGRYVKCGRSKRIVGPLMSLMVATVKPEPTGAIAAANAAGEQPTF